MRLEVLPVEVAPSVTCTVRLTGEAGRSVSPGRASRRKGSGPAEDADGAWTTGPGVAWTGPVPRGETVHLHFEAATEDRVAPYGWFVNLAAMPVDDGHVRLLVDGSAPI